MSSGVNAINGAAQGSFTAICDLLNECFWENILGLRTEVHDVLFVQVGACEFFFRFVPLYLFDRNSTSDKQHCNY